MEKRDNPACAIDVFFEDFWVDIQDVFVQTGDEGQQVGTISLQLISSCGCSVKLVRPVSVDRTDLIALRDAKAFSE